MLNFNYVIRYACRWPSSIWRTTFAHIVHKNSALVTVNKYFAHFKVHLFSIQIGLDDVDRIRLVHSGPTVGGCASSYILSWSFKSGEFRYDLATVIVAMDFNLLDLQGSLAWLWRRLCQYDVRCHRHRRRLSLLISSVWPAVRDCIASDERRRRTFWWR